MRSGSVSAAAGATVVAAPRCHRDETPHRYPCRVPAAPSTSRRTRVLRVASVLAGSAAVIACSSTEPPPAAEEATTSTTAPPIELHPENGVLRATVQGTPTDEPPERDDPGEVLLVGDSVLVLVADELAARVSSTLVVDAADCRQIDATITGPCGGVPGGVSVTSGLAAMDDARNAEDAPPDAAVIVLANNSTVTRAEVDAVMDATTGIDHVWWVNARITGFGRQDLNNQVLAELAEQDPRAGLVDWHADSEGQDWLADNVHPNEPGQAALAALIADRLRCGCTA